MRSKKLSLGLTLMLAMFALATITTAPRAAAQTETALYIFNSNAGGIFPGSGLIFDSAGNLYGVTSDGGAYNFGVAYELSPQAGGGWTETVLYNFGSGSDGERPVGNLAFDAAGNLYGVTEGGGTNVTCELGCGTVFELSPVAGGGWTEAVLHNFNSNGSDGYGPQSALILDSAGNLYGTTPAGGSGTCPSALTGCGTVFELSRQSDGQWAEAILHNFAGGTGDGSFPYGSLVFDSAGRLYGTTSEGGAGSTSPACVGQCAGTVFEMRPIGGGNWSEQILHNFNDNRKDGYEPHSGLTFDATGNLYGATIAGGTSNDGTVFKLSPSGGKYWSETILHSFDFSDGRDPSCTPSFGPDGSLYGETGLGGYFNYGVIYEVTPAANGTWHETTVVKFTPYSIGAKPFGGLIFDTAGNLYAMAGGTAIEVTF
jgi:uncharacterized repeat protein (TIGR03803 family)